MRSVRVAKTPNSNFQHYDLSDKINLLNRLLGQPRPGLENAVSQSPSSKMALDVAKTWPNPRRLPLFYGVHKAAMTASGSHN